MSTYVGGSFKCPRSFQTHHTGERRVRGARQLSGVEDLNMQQITCPAAYSALFLQVTCSQPDGIVFSPFASQLLVVQPAENFKVAFKKEKKKNKRGGKKRKENVHPTEFLGNVGGIPQCVQHIQPLPSPADAPHALAAPICSTVRGICK